MKNTMSPIDEIHDPTPIGPSGVKAVSTIPTSFPLLASDLSQIEAFCKVFTPLLLSTHHQLSSEDASLPERTASAPRRKSTLMSDKCVSSTKPQYGLEQTARWNERFEELVQFRKHYGHCVVPMRNHSKVAFSNWVKRQRHQYHRKVNGLHSTLSDECQKALEELGFIWDPRTTIWDQRSEELRQFYREHGHTSVAKSYQKNASLAGWVKCQRRHYKLLKSRQPSCMTEARMCLLNELSFDSSPRN